MARQPATAATTASRNIVSRRVLVTIKRDQTAETPRVVWAHEIPLLEEIHGEGNVKPVESATLDDHFSPKVSPEMLVHNKVQDAISPPSTNLGLGFVFLGDHRVEYQRLEAVYGMHPEVKMPIVEKVYGRFQDDKFSRLLGQPEVEDLPDAQLRELVASYGGAPQQPAYEATADEKKQALAAIQAFRTAPRQKLLEQAAELGVEIA